MAIFFLIFLFIMTTIKDGVCEVTGNINQNWNWSTVKTDGTKSETDSSSLSSYFNYSLRLTEKLSFMADLRYFYRKQDFSQTDVPSVEDRYSEISPGFSITLNDPIYFLRIGHLLNVRDFESSIRDRRQEIRENLTYFHYNLTPYDFPSFYFQYNHRSTVTETYNSQKETSSKDYLLSSSYNFSLMEKIRGSYYLTHSYSQLSTPDEDINKTKLKNYTGSLDLNYSDSFFKGYFQPAVSYRLNFNKNISDWFSRQGEAYIPLRGGSGYYANGTILDPYPWDINSYSSLPSLTDNVFISTGINLKDPYKNIVIKFTTPQSVDLLKLYVVANDTLPLEILDPNNWKIFRANDPIIGYSSWQEVLISRVNSAIYDPFNNIWVIEFVFSSTQSAQYFRVVNRNPILVKDVYVAEMEVHEKRVFVGGKAHQEFDNFYEEVNTVFKHDLTSKLTLEEGVYLRRTQSGKFSLFSPLGKVWNGFSEEPSERKSSEDPFIEVNRLIYGALRYSIRDNLQTFVRIQKNEILNNQPNRYESRSFNWSFNYVPLERLALLLSLNRIENYLYNPNRDEVEKASRDDTMVLNVNTKIYKEIQWVWDSSLRRSENYTSNSTTNAFSMTHLINIPLTRRINIYINYAFERTNLQQESQDRSYTSERYGVFVTYRPGSALNLSYNLNYQKADENKSISQNVYLNWRITRALLLNSGIGFSETKPNGAKTWNFNSNLVWYPRKFLDLRLIYNLSSYDQEKKTTTQNIGLWLNFRF